TERTTGPAFETRVRSLFHSHTNSPNETGHHTPKRYGETNNPLGSEWYSTADLVEGPASPILPSEDESQYLFELFYHDMGPSQHLLDPRIFLDALPLLFQSPESRDRQMKTMWFTQYLLVMAIGKLVDYNTEWLVEPPGAAYFAEAMRRLPPLHCLGGCGVLAVEILCLVTIYLQWCGRRHDAYLHVGCAVRLAVALGCSLPYKEQQCLPSEKAHRTRVWWTAYMLDRRLSAALGLPAAADDRQLTFDLPRPAPGFPSPEPLNIKVRIARVTGEITTSLYGNRALSHLELVRKIQSILKSLHETGQAIPRDVVIDFTNPLLSAIILCIRPIILQKVKDKVYSSAKLSAHSIAAQLCRSCNEAAIKCIKILSALQRQKQIGEGFVHMTETRTPPPEMHEAVSILSFMARAGNKAAAQRLMDVQQMSSQVWPTAPLRGDGHSEWTDSATRQDGDGHPDNAQRQLESSGVGARQGIPDNASDAWRLRPQPPGGTPAAGGWTDNDPMDQSIDFQGGFLGFDFSDLSGSFGGVDLNLEADGIYSSFHDPALPLTGVDQLDWAEVEKMFASRPT
ncbi:hypothetical protein ACRALDRAFT_2097983, partial [Sodiomyces alcalophilus JCM 7366]|uniref:uncharacterized protein n=1 Tax=Sodiomyces alcalophilus JCM 7366 TaxID=591952 RepID=UPI0039B57B81